jgi:hypothetical protein
MAASDRGATVFSMIDDARSGMWGASDAILQAIPNLYVSVSCASRSAGSQLTSRQPSTYFASSFYVGARFSAVLRHQVSRGALGHGTIEV